MPSLEFLQTLKKNPLPTDFCPPGDCWSRFPGDLPPALQEQPRPPNGRPAQHLPQAHQVPGHLPHQQQVSSLFTSNLTYTAWKQPKTSVNWSVQLLPAWHKASICHVEHFVNISSPQRPSAEAAAGSLLVQPKPLDPHPSSGQH